MSETRYRVLVIDDEPTVAEPLLRRLQEEGWDVSFEDNGEAALKALSSTPFDAVICDLEMPGLGGYEVLEAIAVEPPKQGIAFLLADERWGWNNWSRSVKGRTADFHVWKPYDHASIQEVITMLRRVLAA